ncbi:hypothetical protein K1719_042763 [Acacia pycnantha]|nr:hypothetical protein K1719_042763 [Acacia pycnantha]
MVNNEIRFFHLKARAQIPSLSFKTWESSLGLIGDVVAAAVMIAGSGFRDSTKSFSLYVGNNKRESIVYKAILEDGWAFAVGRFGEYGFEKKKDFENHMNIVAKIRHRNLVKVRVFYSGDDEKFVIYDYIPNRSLASSFSHRYGIEENSYETRVHEFKDLF